MYHGIRFIMELSYQIENTVRKPRLNKEVYLVICKKEARWMNILLHDKSKKART